MNDTLTCRPDAAVKGPGPVWLAWNGVAQAAFR